jgi:vacuolar-type H+-ATPase subunit B/Vma2
MFQGIVSERLAKSQISARHPVRRQVPDERFSQGRPMIDIATEILSPCKLEIASVSELRKSL